MLTVGLWGGITFPGDPNHGGHDASAELLGDGELVAAVEQERRSRVKHTRRPPRCALASVLEQGKVCITDIDCFAVGMREQPEARPSLRDLLGPEIADERVSFVDHHLAMPTARMRCRADVSLVVSLDGVEDDSAGLIGVASRDGFRPLRHIRVADSLGRLYLAVVQWLGYNLFDEYNVMALAPYGDPSRFRDAVHNLFALEADGATGCSSIACGTRWTACSAAAGLARHSVRSTRISLRRFRRRWKPSCCTCCGISAPARGSRTCRWPEASRTTAR